MRPRKERALRSLLMFVLSLVVSPALLIASERTSTKEYNKQYTFTKNSFTDKISSWTKLLNEFKGKPGIHYLEIGTYEGRSALWVLENITTHATAKLTIIDAFEENSYKTFAANVALSGEASKFTILKGTSTQKIREVPFNSIDLAYIDGSGKGIVMLADLVNTWNLVKVGGVIICSRYSLNGPLRAALNLQPEDPGPHEAIDAFLKMYNPYISVLTLQENHVVFRKKRSAE
jgi:predicted O-methyltransferase YrrM